jgi:hypothetical protein
MQEPLFKAYGVDEKRFWEEVNALPEIYRRRGVTVNEDIVYLNHLLSYVKNGPLRGLNNRQLRTFGAGLKLCPGMPDFMQVLREAVRSKEIYRKHNLCLEHYVVSTGLAEIIRGSPVMSQVEGVFGCEFIENPLLPGFDMQRELELGDEGTEIAQIGQVVDNTIKTRFLFEINKGSNKNPAIHVNASIDPEERRIPIQNMIYIADGPTDVPMFAVIRERGGKSFAVYDSDSESEFRQNDELLQNHRIDCYGPADYRSGTSTHQWLRMHVMEMADRLVEEREQFLKTYVTRPPTHVHREKDPSCPRQTSLFESLAGPEEKK